MAKKKGTVSKAAKGKFGYFLMLDGEDFYFNTKFEPKCGEGDIVGIEFDPKGDTRGQVKKITVLTDNSGGYSKSNSESNSSAGDSWGGGNSGGKAASGGGERQDSIVWQHSQEMAISLANLLVAQEAFALKGKPDAKRVQLEGLVDELTARLFTDALNPRSSNAFKTNADIEEDAGEQADGEDEWGNGDNDDDEWS